MSDFKFSYGDSVQVIIKREGQPRFPGFVIGRYIPLDGRHEGYVVEHDPDGIVHVYPAAALERR